MEESEKKFFFDRTLELANLGWGNTHPNPMVGAVIVEEGEIVAEGYHQLAGSAHAEMEAIKNLGRTPKKGASIFVSLEPCSTTGRTPPCVKGILDAEIKKVYIGTTDPNPSHSGRGIEILRQSGVYVEMACEEFQSRATRLNFIFNHNITTGNPLIALKLAESCNGMLAEISGQPSRITEDLARSNMMKWRRLFPAICVGAGTVLADNPNLTARLKEEIFCPVRIVLDATLSTFDDAISSRTIYTDEFFSKTKVITTRTGTNNDIAVKRANELGIHLFEIEQDEYGRIDLTSLGKILQEFELNALFCEGGAKIAQSLLDHCMVDYLFHYRSPKIFDGPDALKAPKLDNLSITDSISQEFGDDTLLHGFL